MRVRVLVVGRVQGVAFRYHTCQQANTMGLSGWVRNLDDGRVEAEFQGAADRVSAMLDWCRRGPSMARVTQVDVENQEDVVDASTFEYRR